MNLIAPMSADIIPLYQSALAKMKSYVTLSDGWDYADGRPLTPEAQAAAIVLLNGFASESIVPQFSLMNSGGLSIEFAKNNLDLTLDVEPTGNVYLYLSTSGRQYEASGPAAHIVAILFDPLSPISAQR